jgi:hypothetical protein
MLVECIPEGDMVLYALLLRPEAFSCRQMAPATITFSNKMS